jgi:uncharacterized Zn finger protein
MRESARKKGARYLSEARLTIERVDPEGVRATVRGDNALYIVSWNRAEGWRCTCPAMRDCSHLVATRLVTVRG